VYRRIIGGVAPVVCHVHLGHRGGMTYCPLDRNAWIVDGSTPNIAKMVAQQYAEFGSARVIEDSAQSL
jgi:hypothetical protein